MESLMSDCLLKNFLKNPNSRWYIVALISGILKLDEDYVDKNLALEDTSLFKYEKGEKGKELDFLAGIKDILINIEGNNQYYDNLFEDKMRYVNHLYNINFSENEYKAKKKIIQIHLNNFKNKQKRRACYKSYYRNQFNQIQTKNIEIREYSLERIKEKWYNKVTLSKPEKLLLILKLSENEKELEEFVKGDAEMSELEKQHKLLEYISKEISKAFDYEKELKGKYKAIGRYEGKQEGILIGEQKGIKEGKEENTKDMVISMHKEKIPIETIAKISKLNTNKVKEILML